MAYKHPLTRPRRLRQSQAIRALTREHDLKRRDLIQPIFVTEGATSAVDSMPGIKRFSFDDALSEVESLLTLGIHHVALFPSIDAAKKTPQGEEAHNPDGLIPRLVRAIKAQCEGVFVISDVALDPYTSHGQDGVLNDQGIVDNDATIEALIAQALTLTQAGSDAIAPSDMMDGRILAIRNTLEKKGHKDTIILSYTAKYASSLYGPFRDAVQSKGTLVGDKKTYQMDPGNAKEAIKEAELDVQEGADMIMVKPGLSYLDVVYRLSERFTLPIIAYQVSGEYAMLKLAQEKGLLDPKESTLETLLSFKRAGASAIITYFAKEVAPWLSP